MGDIRGAVARNGKKCRKKPNKTVREDSYAGWQPQGEKDMPKTVSIEALHLAVNRLLAYGAPSLERAAYALDVSPRTLQRRLSEANLSYSEIVEQVRLEQARRLLGEPGRPVGAIARALGYTDAGSFTRAFARWTGMAPREFRKQR